jgi:hypothetical protein
MRSFFDEMGEIERFRMLDKTAGFGSVLAQTGRGAAQWLRRPGAAWSATRKAFGRGALFGEATGSNRVLSGLREALTTPQGKALAAGVAGAGVLAGVGGLGYLHGRSRGGGQTVMVNT